MREAIKNCQELQQQREEREKTSGEAVKEARASTTDPEARNMIFPNGGYAPGYNVQFCTDVESGVIVGVDVSNHGFYTMPVRGLEKCRGVAALYAVTHHFSRDQRETNHLTLLGQLISQARSVRRNAPREVSGIGRA